MSESLRELNNIKPAIVAVGYDRADSLARLLRSLDAADYGDERDIPLIISLDKSGIPEVSETAEAFIWRFGEKTVINRTERMGLKKHILSCGDLSSEYGSIIMLEDDLYVSPFFYIYARAALAKAEEDPAVAGVSLYCHKFNVFARLPFDAVDDGYDNFYFRFPCSWGQAWTKNKWEPFRKWLLSNEGRDLHGNGMPSFAAEWGDSSWLKYALKYAIEEKLTWFYPRISYTTNFFDKGEHAKEAVTDLQVALSLGHNREFCFSSYAMSSSRYDQYFENEGLKFQSDIYGLKRKDGALDTDEAFYSAELLPLGVMESYGLSLRPVDSNILFKIEGEGIYLYNPQRKNGGRIRECARLEKYFYPGINRKKIIKLLKDRFSF